MRIGIAALVVLAAVGGCAPTRAPSPAERPSEGTAPRPNGWAEQLGRSVTIEGAPGNEKLGAVLQGTDWSIWIDGLEEWPSDLLKQCEGRRLRVSGTVIMREDLPVFVQRPGESPSAGIGVSSEGELNAARRRFLLTDARWSVVE
jgi:hypothetical protein